MGVELRLELEATAEGDGEGVLVIAGLEDEGGADDGSSGLFIVDDAVVEVSGGASELDGFGGVALLDKTDASTAPDTPGC